MRVWKKAVLALGISLVLAGSASAADPFYLNGDRMLPMIQNTGGIFNDSDGVTGLFMDLTTVKVDDVFEDGLACEAETLRIVGGKEADRGKLSIRYSVDGKAWALGLDGQWREIPKNSGDPASLAVGFIRQALGEETLRDKLAGEIDAIAAAKKDNLGKVEPEGAIPLDQQPSGAVKQKGEVQKQPAEEPSKDGNGGNVVVTITESPKVEITPDPPVQVEIT